MHSYEVHLISFQTFFVLAFTIVVDSEKFSIITYNNWYAIKPNQTKSNPTGATIVDLSGPGSNNNNELFHIAKIFKTVHSPSNAI